MGKSKNRARKGKQEQGNGIKKKSTNTKPVFKVAGARSLKSKNKTQKINLNLKKMKTAVRSGTETADQQLSKLQETMRLTAPASASKPVAMETKQD